MMSEAVLRRAIDEDADELTQLTIVSKGFWGYSRDFMKKAQPYLLVSVEHIRTEHIYLLEEKARIVGYYQMHERTPDVMWLDSLFVLPGSMRKGYGSRLFDHAVSVAATLEYDRLEWESDPHAEDFYLHKGAIRIGARESGIQKGRFLPLMRYKLTISV